MSGRIVRGVAAAIALVALTVGTPVLLAVGGDLGPLLRLVTEPSVLWRPDDGSFVLGLLTLAGWIAWAVLAVGVALEGWAALRGARYRGSKTERAKATGFLRGPRSLIRPLVVAAASLAITAVSIAPANASPETATPAATAESRLTQTAWPAAEPDQTDFDGADNEPAGTFAGPDEAMADPNENLAAPGEAATEAAGEAEPDGGWAAQSPRHVAPTAGPDDPAANPAGDSRGAVRTYRVKEGDSLWSIAAEQLGDGELWPLLVDTNQERIGQATRIEVGWVFILPLVGDETPASTYTVQPGDSLSAIAQRLWGEADRWPELWEANRDLTPDPDLIQPGWTLRLPDDPAAIGANPEGDSASAAENAGSVETDSLAEADSAASGGQPTADGDRAANDAEAAAAEAPGIAAEASPEAAPPLGDDFATASPAAPSEVDGPESRPPLLAAVATAVGAILAGGLIAALRRRRTDRLRERPFGRRLAHPNPEAAAWETALGVVAAEVSEPETNPSERLAVGRDTGQGRLIFIGPEGVDVADRWGVRLASTDQQAGTSPWALTGLGHDPDGRLLLIDIEQPGGVAVTGAGHDNRAAVIRAIALDLACRRWSDGVGLVIVSDEAEPLFADFDDVEMISDEAAGLKSLTTAAAERRAWAADDHRDLADRRADPGCGDAWRPLVFCFLSALTPEQSEAAAAATADPSLGVTAVWGRTDLPDAAAEPVILALAETGDAVLQPAGLRLQPPHLSPTGPLEHLLAAAAAAPIGPAWWSGPDETDAALPSWDNSEESTTPPSHGGGPAETAVSPTPPDDLVDAPAEEPTDPADDGASAAPAGPGTRPAEVSGLEAEQMETPSLGTKPVRTDGLETDSLGPDKLGTSGLRTAGPGASGLGANGLGTSSLGIDGLGTGGKEKADMTDVRKDGAVPATDFTGPALLLLGPIELRNAAGQPPARAERSCLEYCAWLLEHPGATSIAMTNGLLVAEGTRRSNLSRLRAWLGRSPAGTLYLPDAYSGRLLLDPTVTSDWNRLRLLIAGGMRRTPTDRLISALRLVRGVPLADAAPGQWHWAEELRTDMLSVIRDLGLVIAERALDSGDTATARWATARSLAAVGPDERLLAARVKVEDKIGNRPEVERLVGLITRLGRHIGVDLLPETIAILQEAIEGRIREEWTWPADEQILQEI
ncbi:MAG: LysM peptidoglycan-binding domain-containing protein [Propionibacteriaceae bacterium]|jgi:nucleoid-associated protein YgaU|nr:LysM peptidoglycan-binding domain-containing protein [Propionibacteriaceae bacterium]